MAGGQSVDELIIRPFLPEDGGDVIDLWRACGLIVPHNDPRKDIERKLAVNPEWFLVGTMDGRVVATCMAGYEGHRGWINYLAVAPDLRRRGIGGQMMAEAESLLRAASCPKINLQVRESNRAVIAFYKALGYKQDEVINLGKRLEHDGPARPNDA
jgi:ribosomal protein S18 acetylase RimI-like enzyme